VDDSVVTLQELKALSNRLIDIHSQHANLLIENMEFQFGVIDTIANNEALLSDYTQCFEQYTQAAQALQDIQSLAKKSQQEADFIQYR
jgi:DNA repair protein RecN (Recombination protein N)